MHDFLLSTPQRHIMQFTDCALGHCMTFGSWIEGSRAVDWRSAHRLRDAIQLVHNSLYNARTTRASTDLWQIRARGESHWIKIRLSLEVRSANVSSRFSTSNQRSFTWYSTSLKKPERWFWCIGLNENRFDFESSRAVRSSDMHLEHLCNSRSALGRGY